jgi:serine/threonine protein kinase/Flp pilus assembly protein TadD
LIGSTISHYKILEKLGEGGMGEVYLAEDTELGRKVALKFLPPHVSRDEKVLERFQREAKATAALQHPNIVTIHEIGSHGDRRFIVMAYVGGDLLSQRIAQKDLSLGQTVNVAIALSDALAEAHGAGIIHRDLKPDNIIIDKRGQPRVLDFGLAMQGEATRLTEEGSTVGTLHYMSPEQSRGEDVDERTDIFSLGAIIYEMITCQKAFPGENSAAIVYKIANEEPQPLSRFNNEASPDLERLVATSLAKDRDVRFQTMSGLAAALRPLQTGSGSGSTAAAVHHAPERKRRRGIAWAAVVAVALIGVTISYRFLAPGSSSDTPASVSSVSQIKTLAVLPLKNASDDPEEQYFADGMTDALISDLSRVSALAVIPRSTMMEYKDSARSISEIAAELGADAVIEGSVWHGNNRVRINVDLILANSAERLWGESYESEFSDVLTLQSELARAITGQVKVNIAPLEEEWLNRVRSVNPEAHKAYMKGHYYRHLVSFGGLVKAGEMYERAIALDPQFAPAYLGLATVYYYMSPWRKARSYSHKALELDPLLADAHTLLAAIKMFHEWDFAGARAELDVAKRLQPNSPNVHKASGDLLLLEGNLDEGISEYRSALALNPLSHPIACALVAKYNYAGHFDKAVEFGIEVADNFPECPFEHLGVGEAYVYLGMYDEAIPFINESLKTYETGSGLAMLGCAYARSGRTDEAKAILEQLKEQSGGSFNIALVHASLGNNEQALDALETAYESRSSSMLWLNHVTMFDDIRDDPRFLKLVEEVRLASGGSQ